MTNTTRTLFSDADLMATLDGRVRQLEGEREGNTIQMEETLADPHVDNQAADKFKKNIESLNARLSAVQKRKDALQATMDQKAKENPEA